MPLKCRIVYLYPDIFSDQYRGVQITLYNPRTPCCIAGEAHCFKDLLILDSFLSYVELFIFDALIFDVAHRATEVVAKPSRDRWTSITLRYALKSKVEF